MSVALRVLNLDDNGPARYARSRGLKRAGFEVLEASTGMEALDVVESNRVDVAVLDVKLPDMSGLEVTRRMKTNPCTRSIRIVQVSAACLDDRDEISSLQHGADIYLKCPLEPGALSIVVDTLGRLRKSEMVLLENGLYAEALRHGTTIGIAYLDLAGYITKANQRYCEIVQRSPQQLCASTLGELAHPSDSTHAMELFRQMSRGDGGDFRIEMRQRVADGSVVWTDSSFSLVRSASGVVRGAVCAVVDITARKLAGAALGGDFPRHPMAS
jgi:PAS domain S-box-containing protein